VLSTLAVLLELTMAKETLKKEAKMKRCKDCGWKRSCFEAYYKYNFGYLKDCHGKIDECEGYFRCKTNFNYGLILAIILSVAMWLVLWWIL